MSRTLKEPLILLGVALVLLFLAVGFVFAQPVVSALFLGWARVVWRAIPAIDVNLAGIATGVLCVAAVVVTMHYFSAWLYGEIRTKKERSDWPAAWRWRWTLCLVAGLMLMFIAGLAGVGLFRTVDWFLQTPVIFKSSNSLS